MRGSGLGNDEKTRKSRKKTSRKPSIWDTIEQYTGLKPCAASRFSEKNNRNLRKAGKARFCHLSSMQAWNPSKLGSGQFRRPGVGARWPSWPSGHQGTKGSQTVKSRKLAFLATFGHSGQKGTRCRVGPPESAEKPREAGKPGKAGKRRF